MTREEDVKLGMTKAVKRFRPGDLVTVNSTVSAYASEAEMGTDVDWQNHHLLRPGTTLIVLKMIDRALRYGAKHETAEVMCLADSGITLYVWPNHLYFVCPP